jgi:hypothetical protein
MGRFGNIDSNAEFPTKNNLTALIDPVVGDDNTLGYEEGSVWVNTTLNKVFLCADSGTGAAVWKEVSSGGGGPLAWTAPTFDLSAFLSSGASTLANANAGFQKSFSATANNAVLFQSPLKNNEVDYDGSNLKFVITSQLFSTAPGPGDNVIWDLDVVLLANGDDGDSKAATLITETIDVSARVANQLYKDTFVTPITGLVGAHTIGITLTRRASGPGADSYSSAVDVFAIEIIK